MLIVFYAPVTSSLVYTEILDDCNIFLLFPQKLLLCIRINPNRVTYFKIRKQHLVIYGSIDFYDTVAWGIEAEDAHIGQFISLYQQILRYML